MSQFEYAIESDHELRILRVLVRGVLDYPNAREVSQRARDAVRSDDCGILYDFRGVSLEISTADLYRFPRDPDTVAGSPHRDLRTALLISHGKDEEDWRFYENTAANAGVNSRVFVADEQAASEWAAGGAGE